MVAFETQRGVLEYLGKNPNDRSLIQRKIARGEIVKEDGMYYVKEVGVGPEDICNASTILELKEEIEKLKEENYALKVANKKLSEWVPSEDLYYHLKFFYERFLNWKRFVDGKVFGQSQYNNQQWKQDTMEMVQPEVYARYNFIYWDVGKSECEFVEQLINERVEKWMELPF